MADFIGTDGNDSLSGTGGGDHFDLSQGGSDLARGKDGDDVFYMGAAFDAGDTILGGKGLDAIELDGDYSAGLAVPRLQYEGVERVQLDAGHDYQLTFQYGGAKDLTVDASGLSAGDHAVVSAVDNTFTNSFTFIGGAGVDEFSAAGVARFEMGGELQASDRLAGSFAVVDLDGDYSAGLTLEDDTLVNCTVSLAAGHDYSLTFAANSFGLAVGAATGKDDHVRLDASAVLNRIDMNGGSGADTLIGGRVRDDLVGGGGDDKIVGGGGGDQLEGGAGMDRFVYLHTKDSWDGGYDIIVNFESDDIIDLHAVDADATQDGDQAFHLVSHLTGAAGELKLKYKEGRDATFVVGEVNGDGHADLKIYLDGDHRDFTNFVL